MTAFIVLAFFFTDPVHASICKTRTIKRNKIPKQQLMLAACSRLGIVFMHILGSIGGFFIL